MTRLDIHASKNRDDIWIMYDTPLPEKVAELEYNPKTRRLFFLFDDEVRRPLGALITDNIAESFHYVDEITLYLVKIEKDKKKILDVQDVPLYHIEQDFPDCNSIKDESVDPKDLSSNFGKS